MWVPGIGGTATAQPIYMRPDIGSPGMPPYEVIAIARSAGLTAGMVGAVKDEAGGVDARAERLARPGRGLLGQVAHGQRGRCPLDPPAVGLLHPREHLPLSLEPLMRVVLQHPSGKMPGDRFDHVLRLAGLEQQYDSFREAEAYPGPMLPSSEAPGVTREREKLERSLGGIEDSGPWMTSPRSSSRRATR